jgi:hypothetical protein
VILPRYSPWFTELRAMEAICHMCGVFRAEDNGFISSRQRREGQDIGVDQDQAQMTSFINIGNIFT